MEIDAINPDAINLDAIAKLPRDKALDVYVRLTSYEHQRVTHSAISALAVASKDIEAIVAHRRETDAKLLAKAQEVGEAKERLTRALAATEDEPDSLDDDGKRAVVRAMEAKIAELQTTSSAHVEWLGGLLDILDAERAVVENLLAERKGPST